MLGMVIQCPHLQRVQVVALWREETTITTHRIADLKDKQEDLDLFTAIDHTNISQGEGTCVRCVRMRLCEIQLDKLTMKKPKNSKNELDLTGILLERWVNILSKSH